MVLKKITVSVAVLLIVCFMSATASPIFAEGTVDAYTLTVDEKQVKLSKEPQQSEVGLIIAAEEVLAAVGIQYEHNSQLDSFEIFMEGYSIMLMHNATHYYVGEKSIDCPPYFTVADVPMIEIGFLSQLIGYTYEVQNDKRNIIINRRTEGDSFTVEETVAGEQIGSLSPIVLMSDINESAAASSASGSVGSRGGSISVATTPCPLPSEENSGMGTLSGTVSLPEAAPEGGLSITLLLENTKAVYRSLYGTNDYYYDAGSKYAVATVDFAMGETSQSYSFDAWRFQDYAYSEYAVFYTADSYDVIDDRGYVQESGLTHSISSLTTDNKLCDSIDIKLFSFGEDIIFDFFIAGKDMTCGDNAIWSYDNVTHTLTISGSGKMYNYRNELPGWSNYQSEITSIVIEDGITSIGAFAFEGLENLAKIQIPESVVNIGYSAFENCARLTDITIPDSVIKIGYSAFENCSRLTNIELPDNLVQISDNLFYGCINLGNITIPDGVTGIGGFAFTNCESLTSVSIPDTVTSIGYSAFENCTRLTSLTIPDNVTYIGSYAFAKCTRLIDITGPEKLTYISEGLFFGCINLTSFTIPDTVASIDGSAFENCESLTSIILPDGVKSIGSYAFAECTRLTSITIPNNVIEIDSGAFQKCTRLTSVILPENITKIAQELFNGCINLISITLPDGVTEVGNRAFQNCTNLASLTIGNSLTQIDTNAFYGCSSLTNVYCKCSEEDMDNMEIGSNNKEFISATKQYVIATKTSLLAETANYDIYMVAPTNIPVGCNLVFACYHNGKMTYYEKREYTGESAVYFVEQSEEVYNQIKVMVWKDFDSLQPICELENLAVFVRS